MATYVDTSFVRLAERFAGPAGLAVRAHADGPALARVVQRGESHLDLLRSLSLRSALWFHLHEGAVHVYDATGIGSPARLRWGDNLREARVDVNAAAVAPVTVEAWDPVGVAVHRASARAPAGAGRPGALDGADSVRLHGWVAASDDAARALAESAAADRASTAAALWALVDGDEALAPGSQVEVAGAGATPSGPFVLTSVSHRVDDSGGFTSELSSAPLPDRRREPALPAEVHLATVRRVDDPEALGRVTVTLDSFGDVETEWLHVIAAAAGKSKGLVMIPEVGDHVVVLAPSNDLGRAIVLGGLYGAAGPPDSGVDGGSVRRYTLRTPGGQFVRLDDGRRALHLEDATGSFVDLSPDAVVVHAAVDLHLHAPGRAVKVTAAAVDFEEG
jgi:phage baseplate assembly protein gpV